MRWSTSFVLAAAVSAAACDSDEQPDSRCSGDVLVQVLPLKGLSASEGFPATLELIALAPNPALMDANVSASAWIDIGFSRGIATDNEPRHMGLQFANSGTPVSTLYVWIDRSLPDEVANAYTGPGRWQALRSDDNQIWTQVAVGPAVFGAFQDRFEISIAETSARYLKLVTMPLPTGVTSDPQFASVLVTELQAYRVAVAPCAP